MSCYSNTDEIFTKSVAPNVYFIVKKLLLLSGLILAQLYQFVGRRFFLNLISANQRA
jgi:hypothetical protein